MCGFILLSIAFFIGWVIYNYLQNNFLRYRIVETTDSYRKKYYSLERSQFIFYKQTERWTSSYDDIKKLYVEKTDMMVMKRNKKKAKVR